MPNEIDYKYGSVQSSSKPGSDEGLHDNENIFKETDLLYYKGRTLSPKEKTAKLIKIAVPVVTAVLLIGGLTWFLLGDFGHLYPGPSGPKPPDSSSISRPVASSVTPAAAPTVPSSRSYTTTTAGTTATEPVPKKTPAIKDSTASTPTSIPGGSSSCLSHSKCSDLGLIGDCCPTTDGYILNCCS
jgi:hypothetical protein